MLLQNHNLERIYYMTKNNTTVKLSFTSVDKQSISVAGASQPLKQSYGKYLNLQPPAKIQQGQSSNLQEA